MRATISSSSAVVPSSRPFLFHAKCEALSTGRVAPVLPGCADGDSMGPIPGAAERRCVFHSPTKRSRILSSGLSCRVAALVRCTPSRRTNSSPSCLRAGAGFALQSTGGQHESHMHGAAIADRRLITLATRSSRAATDPGGGEDVVVRSAPTENRWAPRLRSLKGPPNRKGSAGRRFCIGRREIAGWRVPDKSLAILSPYRS